MVAQRLSGFELPNHPYPYVLLQCEITKNDKNANEPILEKGIVLEIFSKSCFYSCSDHLDCGFLSFLDDSATF